MVSLIIPCYNAEKYIGRCLDSVLNQTDRNIELIVVNDGSTDKTEDIINKYIKKYDNIIHIKQKNMGLSMARNNGVKKATGDYLLFIDSDDYVEKNLLENINKNISDLDVLRYQLNIVYSDKVVPCEEEEFNVTDGISAFEKIVRYKFIEMASLYVINRKYYVDNNFEFEKGVYHEDYGLLPLVIATAKKVKSINYLGYNYVQRDGSIMSSNDTEKMKKKMDDMLFLFTKAIKYLDNIPNSQNVKSFYANSIIDKYNSLNDELKKEYINKIKDLKVISYLSNDNFKRKIKKILYKIKYEVLK